MPTIATIFGINIGADLGTLGIASGIDWLFWAWAVVTVLAFIDIIIPDPLPFVDEAILIIASVVLLFIMGFREAARLFNDFTGFLSNPLIIAFAITITLLVIGSAIYKRIKK